jgi:hypothetical protein
MATAATTPGKMPQHAYKSSLRHSTARQCHLEGLAQHRPRAHKHVHTTHNTRNTQIVSSCADRTHADARSGRLAANLTSIASAGPANLSSRCHRAICWTPRRAWLRLSSTALMGATRRSTPSCRAYGSVRAAWAWSLTTCMVNGVFPPWSLSFQRSRWRTGVNGLEIQTTLSG